LDVQLIHIATGTPRANGQAERANRTILPILAKLSPTLYQWESEVEYAIYNTINRSTNEILTMLLYGIKQLGKPEDGILKNIKIRILPPLKEI